MRSFPGHLAAIAVAVSLGGSLLAQFPAPATATTQHGQVDGFYNPVADSRAVVTLGHARFTVLTPELIRMEWSADGKFEDHASLVFLNRRMPVPKYTVTRSVSGSAVVIDTYLQSPLRDVLTLTYVPTGDGRFTANNLTIEATVDGKPVVWHPGMADSDNLQGATRTLDGALGDKTHEPLGQGLISRSGWALVDDLHAAALRLGRLHLSRW